MHAQILYDPCPPVILTLATAEAETICQKSGLTFNQLLSGFSFVKGLNVPFRSVSTNHQLRDFSVRFRSVSESRPRPTSVANQPLLSAFSLTPEEKRTRELKPRPLSDLPGLFMESNTEMPWYDRFRTVLTRSQQYLEGSQMEAPCLCVLAASTNDQDPLEAFNELSQLQWMPPAFREGQYDPGLQRCLVLLHDPYTAPKAPLSELQTILPSRFPHSTCHVLVLNSLNPTSPNMNQFNYWAQTSTNDTVFFPRDQPSAPSATEEPEVPVAPGCFFSDENVVNTQELVRNIVSKGVIPQMERRIFALNTNITNNRKGVKNAIKLWWRKPKEEERSVSSGAQKSCQYKYNSIESQLRLLADTLFIMCDYETALATYRLAKEDFKADKAHLHYALACQMCAVCVYLVEKTAGRREIQQCIEAAVNGCRRHLEENLYVPPRPPLLLVPSQQERDPQVADISRLITQTSLLGADLFIAIGENPLDAAQLLLMAAAFEDALCSAVLLEKTAWLHLQAGYIRKYAFYMSAAGIRYQSCNHELHAARCLEYTGPVYQRKKAALTTEGGRALQAGGKLSSWARINCYVQSTLALQQSVTESDVGAAEVLRLLQLVGSSNSGRTRQAATLDRFLEICRKNPEAAEAAAKFLENSNDSIKKFKDSAEFQLISQRKRAATEGEAIIHGLLLPKVVEDSVAVITPSAAAKAATPPIADGVYSAVVEKEWAQLAEELRKEEDMVNRHSSGGGTWADIAEKASGSGPRSQTVPLSNKQQLAQTQPVVRARGEPITVGLVLENPLAVPVSIECLQLRVKVIQAMETASMPVPLLDVDQLFLDLKQMGFEMESPDVHSKFDDESTALSYLVDKQPLYLFPGARQHVTLRTCFLVPGVLEVVGIQWKLFGEVWGLHDFRLKGPLLQHNLESRAQRKRAPNISLQSQVMGDMPWLHCQLEGLPSEVLQGEVLPCKLIIQNRGRAAAGECLLKANLPWLAFHNQASSSLEVQEPSPCCDGPSATLFKPFVDPLGPGARVELPVWVRPQGGGKQSLKILVRYRRADAPFRRAVSTAFLGASSAGADPWERTLRIDLEVCVSPSLALSIIVNPSYNHKDEYVLSLEMTNYRSDAAAADRNLYIHKVCGISNCWMLEPLAKEDEAEPVFERSPPQIGWQERLTLHYRLFPRPNIKVVCFPEDLLSYHQLAYPPVPSGAPHNALHCADHAFTEHQVAQETLRQRLAAAERQAGSTGPRLLQGIRRDNQKRTQQQLFPGDMRNEEKEADPHPTSILALCSKESSVISLMVIWSQHPSLKSNPNLILGQHHRSKHVVRPRNVEQHCPLIMTLSYNSNVTHSFEEGEPCIVDVTVHVTNRLFGEENSKVNFDVEALSHNLVKAGSANADFNSRHHAMQNDFVWLGCTRRSIQSLQGGSSVTISLQACFFSAGIYDLNRFKFTVQLSRSKPTVFVFHAPYLLSIASHCHGVALPNTTTGG